MSPSIGRMVYQLAGFPRVSGDEPSNGTIGWGIKWFSPRERG